MIVELIFEKRKHKRKKLLFKKIKKKNSLPATLRSNKKVAF